MLEYGNMDVCFCSGVTFAWMLCNKLFGLNRDTTAALVNFLKLFWNKGLCRYQGEYVALAQKELMAVCSHLAEAKELPQETPVDLLTGLTLCSVDEFKILFKHKLQVAKAKSLEGNHHLSQPEIMGEVRVLLASAAQYYNSLNMSDNLNLPQNQHQNVFGTLLEAKNSCWNCCKLDHSLNQCTQPQNEERIAEYCYKWMEANGWNPKKKGKGGSGNYEREKWGPPKPGELGVWYIDGTPYAYCGKKHTGIECGWNTTHSTKFHKEWAAEGTAFNLALKCSSHELVLKSNKGSKPKSTTSSSSAGKSATANHVVLPDSVKAMLSQLSDSVCTPTEQVLMESVMKSLGLN